MQRDADQTETANREPANDSLAHGKHQLNCQVSLAQSIVTEQSNMNVASSLTSLQIPTLVLQATSSHLSLNATLFRRLLRYRSDCLQAFGSKPKAHRAVRELIRNIRNVEQGQAD